MNSSYGCRCGFDHTQNMLGCVISLYIGEALISIKVGYVPTRSLPGQLSNAVNKAYGCRCSWDRTKNMLGGVISLYIGEALISIKIKNINQGWSGANQKSSGPT